MGGVRGLMGDLAGLTSRQIDVLFVLGVIVAVGILVWVNGRGLGR